MQILWGTKRRTEFNTIKWYHKTITLINIYIYIHIDKMYVSARLLTMNYLKTRSYTVRGYVNTFAKFANVYNFCKGPVYMNLEQFRGCPIFNAINF